MKGHAMNPRRLLFAILLVGCQSTWLFAPSLTLGQVVVSKRCTACRALVPLSSEVGQRCPNCGALWTYKTRTTAPGGDSAEISKAVPPRTAEVPRAPTPIHSPPAPLPAGGPVSAQGHSQSEAQKPVETVQADRSLRLENGLGKPFSYRLRWSGERDARVSAVCELQPAAEHRFEVDRDVEVLFNADGLTRVKVLQVGKRYTAQEDPRGFLDIAETAGSREPAAPNAGQRARSEKTIRLSGYDFAAKDSPSHGPGPCAWNRDNAWSDDQGRVHLKLTNKEDRWTAAEIRSVKPLGGLGSSKWTLSSETPFDQLDPNIVIGCFAFGATDKDGEIDVEFGRFGEPDSGPGRLVVHPAKLGDSEERFAMPADVSRVVVGFDWQPNEIRFEATGTKRDGSTVALAAWKYRGEKIPKDPSRFHAHCNVWMFKNQPPSDAREVEIVIEKFEFKPMASSGTAKSTAGPSITITSPTDGSTTSDRLITVSGTASGLPKGTRITVYVNTDQDYAQDELGMAEENGKWTSRYNVLGGYPLPYEHRVFATAQVGGKTVRSNTVRVTKK
jgi:DNA-directed RNA polymerase subunit RPC12/RpoP